MPKEPRMLVITPSRGRPGQLERLVDAYKETVRGGTYMVVGLDDDDPALSAYQDYYLRSSGWHPVTGPRKTLSGWTNHLARRALDGGYDYLASLGDDHLPVTPGWDVLLMTAIEQMGGTGFSYGNDGNMGVNLPTAVVASVDIVRALDWFCMPLCGHYCVDNAWKDLGEGAGCLAYRGDVTIRHLHHTNTPGVAFDQTYQDAGGFHVGHPDYFAYLAWRDSQMAGDIETIRGLM